MCDALNDVRLTPETDKFTGFMNGTDDATHLVALGLFARKLERERDAALDALCKIEAHYVDGCDTYEAWESMGEIAATFLAENETSAATGSERNENE